MSTLTIDDAIDALRKLAPGRQQELADNIFHLASEDIAAEDIDPADLPSVLNGIEQANRRQFASPERVAEILGVHLK
jgi:hypothetical protein